jgi:hypothetical protein
MASLKGDLPHPATNFCEIGPDQVLREVNLLGRNLSAGQRLGVKAAVGSGLASSIKHFERGFEAGPLNAVGKGCRVGISERSVARSESCE